MVSAADADGAASGAVRRDLPGVLAQEVISAGYKLLAVGDVGASDDNYTIQVDFDGIAGGCRRSSSADWVEKIAGNTAEC